MTRVSQQAIEDGTVLFHQKQYRGALHHFMSATQSADSLYDTVEASRLVGVTFRHQHRLNRAVKYGQQALTRAVESGQSELIARCAHDLAESFHHLALKDKELRARLLRKALGLYENSLTHESIATYSTSNAWHSNRYYATQGAQLLLLFDLFHYRIWLEDDGSGPSKLYPSEVRRNQAEVVQKLKVVDRQLAKRDDQELELDTLLRLIQVVPFIERAPLVHRAEALALIYPHRKNDVWLALCGRPVVRRVIAARAKAGR